MSETVENLDDDDEDKPDDADANESSAAKEAALWLARKYGGVSNEPGSVDYIRFLFRLKLLASNSVT